MVAICWLATRAEQSDERRRNIERWTIRQTFMIDRSASHEPSNQGAWRIEDGESEMLIGLSNNDLRLGAFCHHERDYS